MPNTTADPQQRFGALDPEIAERVLRLGERYDADKLDDLELIGSWESSEQFLDWFLDFIQTGFFTRRQTILIQSACRRKHPEPLTGAGMGGGNPATTDGVTPPGNNAGGSKRKKVRR